MQRKTGFLKVTLVLMTLPVAVIGLLILPAVAKDVSSYYPSYFLYPISLKKR